MLRRWSGILLIFAGYILSPGRVAYGQTLGSIAGEVHDSSGHVPLPYTESYTNPTGRTFRITLRKRFR